MTTITDQLAEALRALVASTFITDDEDLAIDQERGLVAVEDASIALAAYDAQREKHPDTDAFIAAAESWHDADYYQMTDEPNQTRGRTP
jgi:hypothetical protein